MDDLVASKSLALGSNGVHAPKKPPSAISNQLRAELIRILTTGDEKNDGAFTIAVAMHVEKFTAAAREILMTENLAQSDLGSLMMMRKHHHVNGGWTSLGSSLGSSDLIGNPMTAYPTVNNENFGVQAIRQIIDAVQTVNETPAKLVEALAAARSNNLPDVVAALEKKLGVTKPAAIPEGEVPEEAAS